MNINEENQMRELFTDSLKKTFRNGLALGSKAICQVVLDKANDTEKTSEEIVADIKSFCEVSLKPKN